MAACRRYIWYGWVATFGTGLLLAGLLSTGSRSAVLGVCIGLIVITFIKALGLGRFARPIAMGMSVVLILGSFIASFLFTDIVAEIRGGGLHEERAMTERVQLYRDFVPLMLVTDPWFGCGFGTYALASADVFPEKNIYAYQPVHNIFLLIFAEVGVFGVLVVGAFLTSVVRANVARFPQHFSLYAFGALNVLATVAWYDHYLWSSWAGLVLVVIVLAMALRLGEE